MRMMNKLVVVTAAASSMGRAGVEIFLKEGARVAAVDVNAEGLAHLAADLAQKGQKIETIQADLSTPADIRGSINQAASKLGGIDVLWAHAGIPGPVAIENLALAEYQLAMDLNVTSAALAAGEVVGHMRERGGGAIVFTASIAGLVGSMWSPVYSAAKFAVVGLTKSLAQSFAPDNVRVNAICPGLTDTPMKIGFTGRSGNAEEEETRMVAAIPMGRVGRAEESARAAVWLASDEASYITGVALPVDGGFTAR